MRFVIKANMMMDMMCMRPMRMMMCAQNCDSSRFVSA